MSRLRVFSAFSSMNFRRGSTSSPMSVEKIMSASTASSIFTWSRVRVAGVIVGGRAGVHRDLARERRQHMAVAALALQDVEHLLEPDRLLDELFERCPGHGGTPLATQPEVLRAELDQVVLEPGLVLQVLLC